MFNSHRRAYEKRALCFLWGMNGYLSSNQFKSLYQTQARPWPFEQLNRVNIRSEDKQAFESDYIIIIKWMNRSCFRGKKQHVISGKNRHSNIQHMGVLKCSLIITKSLLVFFFFLSLLELVYLVQAFSVFKHRVRNKYPGQKKWCNLAGVRCQI